jgi:antitoxin PrlF
VHSDYPDYADSYELALASGVIMNKKREPCQKPFEGDVPPSCCKAQAIVSVDERGQMVLPKDLREKAGIGPGDKLAIFSWEKEGKACCLFLVKAESLGDLAKSLL